MTEEYHYVVRAKIVDGEFMGWYLDLDKTEAVYLDGNVWDGNDWREGRWDVENNLIMHLGSLLYETQETTPTINREQSNLPPW